MYFCYVDYTELCHHDVLHMTSDTAFPHATLVRHVRQVHNCHKFVHLPSVVFTSVSMVLYFSM